MPRTMNGSTDRANFLGYNIGTITICGWIWLDALPASTDRDMVLTWYTAAESEPYGTQEKNIYVTGTGTLKLRVSANGIQQVATVSALQTGRAYHFAFRQDNTKMEAYLDNVLEATNSSISLGSYTAYASPRVALAGLVNGLNDGETTRTRMQGKLAEVAIWSKMLTAGQIASHRSGVLAPSIERASLVGYCGLNGRGGFEPGLNGNPVTLVGMAPAPHATRPPGLRSRNLDTGARRTRAA